MDEPLRYALVGAGGITELHAAALAEAPELARIVAIADPSEAAVTAAIGRHPGAVGYASVDELVAEAKVDVALVATPHAYHVPSARPLIEHGIPTLIEKPVTRTAAELRELHELAVRHDVHVQPGQMVRFSRSIRALRARIEADPLYLGRIRTFGIRGFMHILGYTKGRPHWSTDFRTSGGGIVINVGVHFLDTLRYLTGHDYADVSARAQYEEPFTNGAESTMAAVLTMTDGAVGTLQASYLSTRYIPEAFNIVAEYGSVRMTNEEGLWAASSHGEQSFEWADQLAGWEQIESDPSVEDVPLNPFLAEHVHFADVVRGRAEPRLTLETNFNTIATAEALMASARTGQTVEVEKW